MKIDFSYLRPNKSSDSEINKPDKSLVEDVVEAEKYEVVSAVLEMHTNRLILMVKHPAFQLYGKTFGPCGNFTSEKLEKLGVSRMSIRHYTELAVMVTTKKFKPRKDVISSFYYKGELSVRSMSLEYY